MHTACSMVTVTPMGGTRDCINNGLNKALNSSLDLGELLVLSDMPAAMLFLGAQANDKSNTSTLKMTVPDRLMRNFN